MKSSGGRIASTPHEEFLLLLCTVERKVPKGLPIHTEPDNYATHRTAAIKAWLARHPRWHLHFTPTCSSWLNQVERFFSELTTRHLRRSTLRSVLELEAASAPTLPNTTTNPSPSSGVPPLT